jgi:hypothetical protein
MTSTLAHSPASSAALVARTGSPTRCLGELREIADHLGQMDLGDPGWAQMEPVLDVCLKAALADADGPRASVWRAIAADVNAPLVVKLRTLALVLQRRSAEPEGPDDTRKVSS